eukprot:SAG22_NODE_257_length_13543_cov_26.100417_9_plen_224_part_00
MVRLMTRVCALAAALAASEARRGGGGGRTRAAPLCENGQCLGLCHEGAHDDLGPCGDRGTAKCCKRHNTVFTSGGQEACVCPTSTCNARSVPCSASAGVAGACTPGGLGSILSASCGSTSPGAHMLPSTCTKTFVPWYASCAVDGGFNVVEAAFGRTNLQTLVTQCARDQAPTGNPQCWSGAFTFARCCDASKGTDGDSSCWSGGFDHAFCCTEDSPGVTSGH